MFSTAATGLPTLICTLLLRKATAVASVVLVLSNDVTLIGDTEGDVAGLDGVTTVDV